MEAFDLRLWNGFVAAGGDPSQPAITDQIVIDSRRIDSKFPLFVALQGKMHDGHHFIGQAKQMGARYALVKRDFSSNYDLSGLTLLYVDDPLKALQEIAGTYRRQFNCRVIAIAGSYGKTMVKDLLYSMLSNVYATVASPESFNSQLGVALSLLTIRKKHEIALIEAAVSNKGEMSRLRDIIDPDHCIITHVAKKHKSTLGNLHDIAGEIVKIFSPQAKSNWTILPKDPHLLNHIEDTWENVHFWSEPHQALPHASFESTASGIKRFYQVHFPDKQIHQGSITTGFYYFLDLINITAKAAWLNGISSEIIKQTLCQYVPEPVRTEIWKSQVGTTFINDAYCSDPQSIDKALKYFDEAQGSQRKIFAFGGMRSKDEHVEVDYRRIGNAIHRAKVDHLILFGAHPFNSLIEELHRLSPHLEISTCSTYRDTLKLLRENVRGEDLVLIKGDKKFSIDLLMETFNDSISTNQCTINLAAVAENLTTIQNKLPVSTRIMVIVKALAYGTDEVRMAKFLKTCGIDILGVSYVDEGVSLRRAGIEQSIFVINAAVYEAVKVVKWNLEVGVSDKDLIEAVANEAERQNRKIKVHLHIDTGMGRFGCRPEDAISLAKLIAKSPFLEFEGVMTHFACADDPSQDNFTIQQAQCLENIHHQLNQHGYFPKWIHAANSSGVARFQFPQFNMVRLGLSVYGLYSSKPVQEAMELRLALSLSTRIVGINTCKQGETISYGRTYSVRRDQQRIAVIPIGYFDGLHRNYSGRSSVTIHGKKAQMVGKICMDFMMVDVTDIPNATAGDPVLIFGEDEHGNYLSPEDLATSGDSIVHELIASLGPRIQRIFIHEEAHRTH